MCLTVQISEVDCYVKMNAKQADLLDKVWEDGFVEEFVDNFPVTDVECIYISEDLYHLGFTLTDMDYLTSVESWIDYYMYKIT